MILVSKAIFLKMFYLFIHEGHKKKGRDISRGRSRVPAGPQRQPKADAQKLNHQASLQRLFYKLLAGSI